MWNEPEPYELYKIPDMYATEDIMTKKKIIHMHFFLGKSHWYIAEYDRHDTFFGFAILNGDKDMAEWGYVSFSELKDIKIPPGIEVDRDLYWRKRPAGEVEKIVECNKVW